MNWRYIVLVFLLLYPSIAKPDPTEERDAAHLGVSFAVTTFLVGLNQKMFRMEREPAMVFGTIEAFTIGLVYEMMKSSHEFNSRGIAHNAIGIGLANITIFTFY